MSASASFLLLTFRQENFVRDAVKAALAQDHHPLEIIISDDASPDATFDVAADEVARHCGAHVVRLNRNQQRIGSAEHLAKVVAMARGEFIVTAHGDDISLPHRTRALAAAAHSSGASLVSSNATYIDARGHPHGLLSKCAHAQAIAASDIVEHGRVEELLGATLAFHRAVIEEFSPLTRETMATGLDQVLPMRAAVLAGVYYLAEPLVLYRRHDSNMSNVVVDRTGTQLVFDESCAAQDMAARVRILDDLIELAAKRPGDAALRKTRAQMEQRLLADLRRWSGLRGRLHAGGHRPTWMTAEAMMARRIKRRFSTRWWELDREPLVDKIRRRITRLVAQRPDAPPR